MSKINWPGSPKHIAPVVGCGGCAQGPRCWAWREVARQACNSAMPTDVGHAALTALKPSAVIRGKRFRRFDGWSGKCALVPSRLARMRKMRGVVALCLHGDLFAPGVKDEWIGQILNEIFFNPLATWLVLTKQPKRMADCVRRWYGPGLAGYGRPTPGTPQERMPQFWPGVSVSGDQDALRIDELLATPAAHHWLSYEPATEPLRLFQEHLVHQSYGNDILDAVIVGAESGPGRRPMQPEWAARIGDQCRQAGVPFFLKQGVRDGKVVSYPPPTNWPWIRKE